MMKKKLESQLKDLANNIINTSKYNSASLKEDAKKMYEALTILSFTEENLNSFQESSKAETKEEKHEKVVETPSFIAPPVQQKPEKDDYLPDGTEYNDAEAITEPNTEKIKDIVAQMPMDDDLFKDYNYHTDTAVQSKPAPAPVQHKQSETSKPEASKLETPKPETPKPEAPKSEAPKSEAIKPEAPKPDFRNIGVDYDNLPNFEPIKKKEAEKPRSLNDRLKKGINVGLNERLSFIRHLFDGNSSDYNRVISQLNTFDSLSEAKKFIQLVVKPDYKNWVGKEDHEQRFMELVENKFNQ